MTAPPTTDDEAVPTGAGAALGNLRLVFGSRDLRRVQLAFLGSVLGDWAYSTAIMVYAYQEGGAALLGVWAGARLLLQAVAAPLGGAVADRMSRRTYMLANDAVRLGLVLVVVALMLADVSALVVLGVATGVSLVGASFRPAQAGLIPKLVTSPHQLTASSATADIMESVAIFVGPALGGLLLMVMGVEWAVLVNGLSFAWSLALVAGVRRVDDGPAERSGHAEPTGFLREATEGFRALGRDRDLVAFTGLLALNGFLAGALNVLLVLIAVEVFDTAAAIGYLNSLAGVGTVLGGAVTLTFAARLRLGRAMVFGVLGWCVPMIVMGLVPHAVALLLAMFVLGFSDPWLSVGYGTIPQRVLPLRLMSRVFGALESAFIAAMALGSVLVPVLLEFLSIGVVAVAVGTVGAGLTLVCATRMPHLDARVATPQHLPLVRSISLFAPLNAIVQDTIARQLEEIEVSAGQVVVAEGHHSDRFYVIVSGEVEVTQGGRVLRHEHPGDFFGEIGLLRDVPRTATVTATAPSLLLTLSREDFLDAMTQELARTAAEEIAVKRLAT